MKATGDRRGRERNMPVRYDRPPESFSDTTFLKGETQRAGDRNVSRGPRSNRTAEACYKGVPPPVLHGYVAQMA